MGRVEHFRHILDAIDIGLDGGDPAVLHDRPPLIDEELPPLTTRSLAVFPDGSVYSIVIEAVDA